MSETPNLAHFQSLHDGDQEVDILSRRSGDVLTIVPLELYSGPRLKKLLGREYLGDDLAIKAALEPPTVRKNTDLDDELTLKKRVAKTRLRQLNYKIDNNRKLCERFNLVIEMAQVDRGAYLQNVLESMKLGDVTIGAGAMVQILQELDESFNERARPNQIFQVLKSALSRLARRDPKAAEAYLQRLGAPEVNKFSLLFPDSHKNEERKAFNRLQLLPNDVSSGVTMDFKGFHYDDTKHREEKVGLELDLEGIEKEISDLKAVPPRTAIMPVIQLREMEALESPSEDLDLILAEFADQVKRILKLSDIPENLFSFELGLLVADRFKRQMVKILGRKKRVEPPVIVRPPSRVRPMSSTLPSAAPNTFRFDPSEGYVSTSGEAISDPTWEDRKDFVPDALVTGVSMREQFGPVVLSDPKAYDPDKQ